MVVRMTPWRKFIEWRNRRLAQEASRLASIQAEFNAYRERERLEEEDRMRDPSYRAKKEEARARRDRVAEMEEAYLNAMRRDRVRREADAEYSGMTGYE